MERQFHTVGMKFNIDIYFFNKFGKIVKAAKNMPPGIKTIDSGGLTQYVIECLPLGI